MGRQPPFNTVVGAVNDAANRIDSVPIMDLHGLAPVDVVGSAGLLVHRRVFEAMPPPWFEAGSLLRHGLGEDWWFCLKAKKLGFQTWVDTALPMGHTTTVTLWPHQRADGTGGVQIDLDNQYKLVVDHTRDAQLVAA
jgi:hypothetical protein